ncbi:hypothetical protein V6N11_026408 [Hibiscus sabdariffa]|uniref:Uncharacterized protein n=1 Tax=Hibiscus sabdariffa TaxID=183260 RepID=A0ABR2SWG2_9ROSI
MEQRNFHSSQHQIEKHIPQSKPDLCQLAVDDKLFCNYASNGCSKKPPPQQSVASASTSRRSSVIRTTVRRLQSSPIVADHPLKLLQPPNPTRLFRLLIFSMTMEEKMGGSSGEDGGKYRFQMGATMADENGLNGEANSHEASTSKSQEEAAEKISGVNGESPGSESGKGDEKTNSVPLYKLFENHGI